MNLEGTKHEKAVLIIVAYIIGFTSGFIAFGLSALYQSNANLAALPTDFTPQATPYTPPTSNPPADSESDDVAVASYSDGKLYATIGAEKFVLSISDEVMPNDNVEGFSTQGIHIGLPAFSTSSDGRFIHFCEQKTAEDSCMHFVFDATSNLIQFVAVDGTKLSTSLEEAEAVEWNGNILSIGNYRSIDGNSPWEVANTELSID